MTLAAAIAEARVLADQLASARADVGATTIAEIALPTVERSDATASDRPHILSIRELEVLRLVVEGRTDREIADALVISPRTATTHVTHILNKLGLASRTAAASYAVRHGLA
jgi:DNA-binding NarL/FixJ family response regulator